MSNSGPRKKNRLLRRLTLATSMTIMFLTACAPPSQPPSQQASQQGSQLASQQASQTEQPKAHTGLTAIARTIDGDTILTQDQTRIRTIGDNAPERGECYYQNAKDRVIELIGNNSVTLHPDPTQRDTDKYGRALRYVELADGTDLQLTLIQEGFASEATFDGHYQRQQSYRAAQAQAQADNRGKWGQCK